MVQARFGGQAGGVQRGDAARGGFGTSAESGWVLGARVSVVLLAAGCGGTNDRTTLLPDASPPAPGALAGVVDSPAAALLSVAGTARDDVWIVGADDGQGPVVLHYDGAGWERKETGTRGDLWWVHALSRDEVYASGVEGQVLRYRDGRFERMETPGFGRDIVFGIWGRSGNDLYAAGASRGRTGFLWHYDGSLWQSLPLPQINASEASDDFPSLFKVWGGPDGDVWAVGDRGTVLRGGAAGGFELVPAPTEERLFTVAGTPTEVAFVGGSSSGVILESAGTDVELVGPEGAGLFQGVAGAPDGSLVAVGVGGSVFRRGPGATEPWTAVPQSEPVESFHACWVDPEGGLWAVGGKTLSQSLDAGLAVTSAPNVAKLGLTLPPSPPPACPAAQVDPAPSASMARRWNEQLLGAIRRDLPRPTVHARNLLHFSIAAWDAWAAFEPSARGIVVTDKVTMEKATADQVEQARAEAIAYAAYRVLLHRYRSAIGGAVSKACFDDFMTVLGFDPALDEVAGDSPRALGNRIGQSVIDRFATDGANEAADYADPTGFRVDAPLLTVDLPGTRVVDPTRFQSLELALAVTQNGIVEPQGVRPYIGSHWGGVTPFGLLRPSPEALYWDPGGAPTTLDDRLVEATVGVLRRGAELDLTGDRMDISPGAYGNNPLGSNAGTGHASNPTTGAQYAAEWVRRGDFSRVLAEFWADGPTSETPPGHWNALANQVADHPEFRRRLYGSGAPLDPLAWDVHAYLALNGALHDAAIAAWELKRAYMSARPITLVRYLAGLGQRSEPSLPFYHPGGLPLVPGLIELITDESSAPGQRHEGLRHYVGELALYAWRGEPGDRERSLGGVGWIRALDWIPYQRRFFVTPAFPGYVSGHSTFSRAAATVLDALTGTPFFPGGLGTFAVPAGYLVFEYGPSEPFELEWATYYDAADQAGQSRIWGGIHTELDDFDGRRLGDVVGRRALEKILEYYAPR